MKILKHEKDRTDSGKIKSVSLRYRIAAMLLWVVLILIVLFGLMMTYNYNRAVEQRSKKHIEENIRFMSRQISQVFSDGVLCTNYLTLSINSIESEFAKRQVDRDNRILSILNQTILMFDGIDSILFVDDKEQIGRAHV